MKGRWTKSSDLRKCKGVVKDVSAVVSCPLRLCCSTKKYENCSYSVSHVEKTLDTEVSRGVNCSDERSQVSRIRYGREYQYFLPPRSHRS